MRIRVLILMLLFAAFNVSAKTVLTLTKSSPFCSVDFVTSEVKRIDGKRYLGLDSSDINLADLSMAKGTLESAVSSEWLNAGEQYFISAYINHAIGPKHIPIVIPYRSEGYSTYLDINIDEILPCTCFKGAEKPMRCHETSYINITFQDNTGGWWRQTGENTAERVVD